MLKNLNLGRFGMFYVFAFFTILATIFYQFDATFWIGLIFYGLATLYTLIIIFFGWKKLFVNDQKWPSAKDYIIKQGRHYSTPRFPKLYLFRQNKKFVIERDFLLSNSCFYKLGNANDFAINKLFGFSVGLFGGPKENSFRFGWNCFKDNKTFSLFAFYHLDGRMLSQYIGDIYPEKRYVYRLEKDINSINFIVTDKETGTEMCKGKIDYKQKNKWNFGWKLFFYFGGEETAPHDLLLF